jgi:N-acyl-D-amino-acid deacylase
LRSAVVGYAARAASEDELKTMERMLSAAMDEGGWGLTTGLIYQPGKYSTPSEVERLSRIAAERGGIYATHMRSEGDAILEAIDEVIALARATGIRAEISHLKTSGKANWHKIDAVIDKVAGGIDEGVLLGADRYPFCAAGTDLDIVLPDWAQEGAAKGEMERFADPALRDRIVAELNASPRDWSTVMIGGTWHAENKIFSGRRVSEICVEMTVGERIVKILEKDGCKTGAFFFGMSEENLNRIMGIDWIVPGSDASLRAPWGPLGADYPHPRAYATMPEFLRLALNASCSSVERVVERMTSIPATRFGIRRRGVLKRGNFADIAIWSESEFKGQSTYAKPHQFSLGMKCVMVNGKISYRDGRFTGERGGRFLEK